MISALQSLLASLALSFDLPILDWIQANLTSPLLDKIVPILTLLCDPVTIVVLIALLIFIPKTRKMGSYMFVALVLGLIVCNATLKPLVARIRPYDLKEEMGETINLLVKKSHDFSFPSGHTIAAFEVASVLLIKDKRWGIPVTILAVVVTFTRLYLYVHYPTDVLFSIVFGFIFGFLGCVIMDAVYKKYPMEKFLPKKGKYQR